MNLIEKRQKQLSQLRVGAGVMWGLTLIAVACTPLAPPIMLPVSIALFFASAISTLVSKIFAKKVDSLQEAARLGDSDNSDNSCDLDNSLSNGHDLTAGSGLERTKSSESECDEQQSLLGKGRVIDTPKTMAQRLVEIGFLSQHGSDKSPEPDVADAKQTDHFKLS